MYPFLDAIYKWDHVLFVASCLSYFTCSDHLYLLAGVWTWHCLILPDGWFIYRCVCRTHFLYSFLCSCPFRLQPWPSFRNWSSWDGMGTLVFENLSFPWLIAVSSCTSIFHILKVLHIVFSSGRANGDFLVIPSKLISWWEFLLLNFSHFYFCKPSVLIISCFCSHPSTLSFSIEV